MAIVTVLAVIACFLVPILIFAPRAARRGRKFKGSQEPIEAFTGATDGIASGPWFGVLPGMGGTFGMGWRRRVRLQAQFDAERTAERHRKDHSHAGDNE